MKYAFLKGEVMEDDYDDYYDGEEYDDGEYDDPASHEEDSPVLYETALKEFKPHTSAHSAYISSKTSGKLGPNSVKDYCYFDINNSEHPLSKIVLFFGQYTIENAYKPELWCDWVINRSQYKVTFLTKDAKKGLESGFEVDPTVPFELMRAGMMVLRHQFEFTSWSWGKLLDMGFDEWESYALATHFSYSSEGGFYGPANYPENHLLIPPEYCYASYLGDCEGERSWECASETPGDNYSLSLTGHWAPLGAKRIPNLSYPKTNKKDKEVGFFGEDLTEDSTGISKEQLTMFLNKLKGL